jgi:heptosyltransferase-3
MSTAGKAKPVVIYRLGSLGDTIVALPCFHAIAKAEPHAQRIVLTNIPVSSKAAPLEGILGGSGLIHGTMAYPVGTRSLKALWQLRGQLKALGADTLYYLTPARGLKAVWRDVVYFKLCGFKRIIGAPTRAALQTNLPQGPEQHLEQEASRMARCMAALGPLNLQDRALWDLRLTQAEQARGQAITAAFSGQPFLAINMGGKVAKNDWGQAHWQALLGRLSAQHPTLGLMVVGAQEDSARAQAMAPHWRGPVVDACGQLSPRESAAAMQHACVFAGHDSGPLHLAAAVNVPCVGLFGDNNPPAKWHPFGPNHRVIHRMAGVSTITVDDVFTQVQGALQASAAQTLHTTTAQARAS